MRCVVSLPASVVIAAVKKVADLPNFQVEFEQSKSLQDAGVWSYASARTWKRSKATVQACRVLCASDVRTNICLIARTLSLDLQSDITTSSLPGSNQIETSNTFEVALRRLSCPERSPCCGARSSVRSRLQTRS